MSWLLCSPYLRAVTGRAGADTLSRFIEHISCLTYRRTDAKQNDACILSSSSQRRLRQSGKFRTCRAREMRQGRGELRHHPSSLSERCSRRVSGSCQNRSRGKPPPEVLESGRYAQHINTKTGTTRAAAGIRTKRRKRGRRKKLCPWKARWQNPQGFGEYSLVSRLISGGNGWQSLRT